MRLKTNPALEKLDHRPWPLPKKPWIMRQKWRDLLFLHWPIDPEAIRAHIPAGLTLDLFGGKAWLAVVPFDMNGVTARGCPAPRSLSDFPEINLRTYVTCQGKPGVWFFSLDVSSGLAVWAARTFFHLPYFKAEVSCKSVGLEVQYRHQRGDLLFSADYYPVESFQADPKSFEHWATARYCLYCQSGKGILYRGEIQHPPWPLERAEITLHQNTLLADFPVGEMHPSLLFSRSLDVVVFPLQRLLVTGH